MSNKKLFLMTLIGFAAFVGFNSSAFAQVNASASVTAEVQRPLTVTKTRDLDFGEVFPGVDKSVAVADATAAVFHVFGQDNAPIQMTFTLPTTLASSGNMLVIKDWTGRHNTTNSPTAGTDFLPSTTAVTASLSSTGNLYVFLGASVAPTVDQPSGTYTAPASITVTYF